MRWNDWKVHFASVDGNIATGTRAVTELADHRQPAGRSLREDAASNPALYLRWYADNIWLFVPVQQKVKDFLTTIPDYPFQEGSSLNAARHQLQTRSRRWRR